MADNFLQALLAQVGATSPPGQGVPVPQGFPVSQGNIVGSAAMGIGMSDARKAAINQAIAQGVGPTSMPIGPTITPGGAVLGLSPAEAMSRQIGQTPAAIRGALGPAGSTGMGAANIFGALPAAGQTGMGAANVLGALPAAGQTTIGTGVGSQLAATGAAGGEALAGAIGATATTEAVETAVSIGLRARVATMFPALGGAGIAKGAMVKGGLAAVGGLVASGWLDSQDFGGENSELDQALKGGALGAGAGAGLALLLGASAGPVGWAALAGAGLFAAGNMVFGDNDSTDEKIDKLVNTSSNSIETLLSNPQFGIDPETAQQVRTQVMATTQFYKDAKDLPGLQAYIQSLAGTVPSFLMEAQSRNQANQQKMALQAAFGPVYSRMAERSANAADQAFQIQMEAANAVSDPKVRAALQTQASREHSSAAELQAAYAQQIAAAPQQLPPSAQMVQDQAGSLIQQAMGMGLAA